MPALGGGERLLWLTHCRQLRAGCWGWAEGRWTSPASLLARAMDIPCGVASSPALGVEKFWKALASLLCWLMSCIGACVSAGILLRNLILTLDSQPNQSPYSSYQTVFAKRSPLWL